MEIKDFIEQIENKDLKTNLLKLWSSLELKFREMPASVKYHHCFRGGLYIHTKEVMGIALFLYGKLQDNIRNEGFTQDDVILVAFAHDLDKINKYVKNKKQFGYNNTEFVWNDQKINTNDTADVVNVLGKYNIHLNGIQLNALTFSHGGWSLDRGKMTALATILHCADILSLTFKKEKQNGTHV